ncbi:Uncharacterised protein [Mycobacteroides abscessus subsp. abscessus]|nr:Uncharacterised protein [Mycobacteroides abscessus subsp. abscessus]
MYLRKIPKFLFSTFFKLIIFKINLDQAYLKNKLFITRYGYNTSIQYVCTISLNSLN